MSCSDVIFVPEKAKKEDYNRDDVGSQPYFWSCVGGCGAV